MPPAPVVIVLAAYQGEKFLGEQIESIRRQSLGEWTLLVRDDGSSDQTVRIAREAAAADPRIELLPGGGGGPMLNFAALLEEARRRGAEYVFTSDQDDVWRPDKLQRQLQALCEAESLEGGRRPCLAYSDLEVVDGQLRTVSPSFLQCSRLLPRGDCPLRTLLGRSYVLGCAAAVNRPLLDFALPLPEEAVMHDWWLALSAAAVGRVVGVPQPLVQYRRHGVNSSGPSGFWAGLNPLAYSWPKRWRAGTSNFRQSIAQARALRRRLDDRSIEPPPGVRETLDSYLSVFARPSPGLAGVWRLWRHGMPQLDWPRRLIFYACVLLTRSGGTP